MNTVIIPAPEKEISSIKYFESPDVDTETPSHPKPPIEESSDIEYTTIEPSAAFEVFAGKVYDPKGYEIGRIRPGHQRGIRREKEEYTSGDVQNETPMDRYRRLESELQAFLDDIQVAKEDDAKKGEPRQLLPVLESQLRGLKKQLDEASTDLPHLITTHPVPPAATQVSPELLRHLEQLSLKSTPGAAGGESGAAPSDVTYELYVSREGAGADTGASLAALESRVHALEAMLGESKVGSSGQDLLGTVSDLEKKISSLDESKINAMVAKAKTVVVQLEEVAKAAEKAAQKDPTVSSQKAQDLLGVLERWDQVAVQVPALSARLQALRRVHDDGLLVAAHVEGVAHGQHQLQQALDSQTKILAAVQASVVENSTIVQENMRTMEQRLAALSDKLKAKGLL
eukprot:TRINITY_DN14841_c0_g1::TRINITY_DN14841_c0_g1_i1::g.16198::m.16198 TRINITY_DN14841_c0_g1::TRINITY_DN14841_c0_g1_i1::g.16198  ORF type:complete len:400 (+),score=117.84,sp/Q5FW42/DCTN2_XENTR/27.20/2e-27,Dynamitin/PF04912.9/1.2e-46,GAS/PF13851.1/0.019,GAS/PF13851.1/4.2e+03,AAA_2/PF07724.9/8.7e+03,AAA_2/PF07724.9/0.18,MutS_III/PF05192.13/0.35,Fzo_mitofusin/PF04799.8/4.6,Fzo_mitofusin/PF04799.8/30,HWE_HK/PF07536.9/1.7e+03,HWE_HK/PF07536.9/1.5e+03,HWE_HK/PF07536.9/4.1,HWE_HK/PF07536.9/13,HTH_1/PF00126